MEEKNSNIATIMRKDGKKYSVRQDRTRYFFPDEWNRFINTFSDDKHKLLFITLLHTGSRIMEALHLKPESFDFERNIITFKVVKSRKANKKLFSNGKKRMFFISEQYCKLVRQHCIKNNLASNDYIFLDKKDLPDEYESLTNQQKKKFFNKQKVKYHLLMKNHLMKANIENYQDFSLHNIRKTYGNWMRLFKPDMQELCYRMGHDFETFMSNYGSNLLFSEQDKIKISKIMGTIK